MVFCSFHSQRTVGHMKTIVEQSTMAFVTLVRPPAIVPKWAPTTPVCPPIGVAYIASASRRARDREAIVDALREAICDTRTIDEQWPMVPSVTTDLRRALPNASIIASGEHITAIPEFNLADCPALDY
jgi:hypothetical protein